MPIGGERKLTLQPFRVDEDNSYTIQMNRTWVVGDEVMTDVMVTVPTFPVCCIHRRQKEGGVNM